MRLCVMLDLRYFDKVSFFKQETTSKQPTLSVSVSRLHRTGQSKPCRLVKVCGEDFGSHTSMVRS